MKLLCEVDNSLEAHVIVNMLEQNSIKAELQGEQLSSGLGVLPPITIRIMVEEKDYIPAKLLVEKLNQQPSIPAAEAPKKSKIGFGGFIVGFVFGMITISIFYRLPISATSIDHNKDGNADEFFGYYQTQIDRNFDGEIDYELHYKKNGVAEYSNSDEDFDGRFETTINYEHGNLATWESDRSGIGFNDYVIRYKNGVIDTETFYSLQTNKPLKVNYFDGIKILKSEFDSDKDGRMDTIYEYDSIGEINKRHKIN